MTDETPQVRIATGRHGRFVSRRTLTRTLLAGLAAVAAPPAFIAGAAAAMQRRFRSVVEGPTGLAPPRIVWGGTRGLVSGGATAVPGLEHALATSLDGRILSTEIRNTPNDRRSADRPVVRRSEISFSETRYRNGQEYWMAISVLPVQYSRENSLRRVAGAGGPFVQLHADDTGSPAFALRRTPEDRLRVTAVGGRQRGEGATYCDLGWTLDAPHHLVIRFNIDPRHGALTVWMDGVAIVNAQNIPLGLAAPGRGSFVKIGCYYPRGIGPDPEASVTNMFANYIPPQFSSLLALVAARPAWPSA